MMNFNFFCFFPYTDVCWALYAQCFSSDCLWIFFTELGKALSIQCLVSIGVGEKSKIKMYCTK